MALVLKDRVLESSTSTGTGSFTLTGAQTGYQSFSAIGNGNTTYYTIQGKNSDGTLTGEWEVGVGTWSTGNTLARDTVLSNSLGTTALISFSVGAKDVFSTYPSEKAILGDTSAVSSTGTGSVVLSGSPTLTSPILNGNVGVGITPLTWTSTYNSLQIGLGGSISNPVSSAEMSISSNLKYQTSYKYVNNGLATRYYQTAGQHYWAVDSGTGVANSAALMTDVMVLDTVGNLTINGTLIGQNASVQSLNSPTGSLQVNTGGAGDTTIGSSGSGYTTYIQDDQVSFTGTASFNGGANFVNGISVSNSLTGTGIIGFGGSTTSNQTFATNQTSGTFILGGTSATGSITIGRSTSTQAINIGGSGNSINIGASTGVGTLTLGRSTGIQTVEIATGATASASTKAINIGLNGLAGSTTNIAIGSTLGTSITTLNGKTSGRIVPRVSTTTSSATPTINTDNIDQYGLTAQAVDITSFTTNLSGTPTDGQKLWIYIVGTAARAITWGTSFEASTVALPTTTVTTNRLDIGFVWNVATSKWRCVAVA
jgi:hypothetical protein